MKIIFLILGVLWSVFVYSQQIEHNISAIKSVATPIQLAGEETDIILSDYFMFPNQIDSFQTNSLFAVSEITADIIRLSLKSNVPFVFNLGAYIDGIRYDIPIFKDTKKEIHISIKDLNREIAKVQIKGQMTNWTLHDLALNNGIWSTSFSVLPGQYQYLFVLDGKEVLDPSNTNKISNGMNGSNSVIDASIDKNTIPSLRLIAYENNSLTLSTSDPGTLVNTYLSNQLIPSDKIDYKGNRIIINIPDSLGDAESIRIYGNNDFGRSNDVLIPIKNGKVVTSSDMLDRSNWQANIYYFLLVDRFYDGDSTNTQLVIDDSINPKANYYGGDLKGIVDKLKDGYFANLGVNAIWLSPITQNPETAFGLWPEPRTTFSGYHGYWPISSSQIDHRFGTDEVLEELISIAHSQDINVIIDYVANHVHQEHPVYIEHPEWATSLYLPDGTLNTEKWDEYRLTTWFDTFLPTLDFSRPEVINTMSDSALYWMNKFDLDGFRHDATKHIQLAFWRSLTNKIKHNVAKPIFQIGETYGSPDLINSYINSGMLDSQFDFNLYDAAVQAFAKSSSSFVDLESILSQSIDFYGSHHLMGNISGNQDRARFITYASGDVSFSESAKKAGWTRSIQLTDSTAYNDLAMLQAFNMTIPGLPMIYYGDEYGAIGAGDPDNRRMMNFDHLNQREVALKDIVAKLIQLRKDNLALSYGDLVFETIEPKLFVYSRQYLDNKLFIVFNKSSSDASLDIPDKNYISLFGTTKNGRIKANSFDILKVE